MSSSQSEEVSAAVRPLSTAVQEALQAPQDAQRQPQLQSPAAPAPYFIIRHTREESSGAFAGASGQLGARETSAARYILAPAGTGTLAFCGLLSAQRLEVHLDAQGTGGAAVEQRLVHLEAKLNALRNAVAQAPAERVKQQHAELARWHQQNYEQMRTMVMQVNWREEDNRQLRDALASIRQQLGRVGVRGNVPILWSRSVE
ncbi:hypothetical protein CGC21_7790 [Leishmania donovani]|uniref:Uncharacterized protein n=1 Tax=Leishmania donovani TaxID=5661 RepID=A0A504XB08_LEIDO|nr:hypothetical protein CGC21_7790 [Leishmania donovani]